MPLQENGLHVHAVTEQKVATVDVSRRPAVAEVTAKVSSRLPWLAVVAAVLLALVAGTTISAVAATSGDSGTPGPAYSMEDDFFELLNQARADEGHKALQRVEGVNNVAREWAIVMAEDNELKHRPSLRDPFDGNWQLLGENVGVGYGAESLHQGFMDSPGHRANIMGDYDYVGIGVALMGSRAWVAFNFVKGDPSTKSQYDTNPLEGAYPTGAGTSGPFYDINSSVHVNDIKELDAADVAIACATSRYCPAEGLRRAEMAALLTRALNLPSASENFSDVPSNHLYADEIGALARAKITLGCNPPANDRFCPEDVVTRQQMASFFVRALNLNPREERPFGDVSSGNVHWKDIAALARSGITFGCNPPNNTRYCPSQDVTRGQMASFIVRGIDL